MNKEQPKDQLVSTSTIKTIISLKEVNVNVEEVQDKVTDNIKGSISFTP